MLHFSVPDRHRRHTTFTMIRSALHTIATNSKSFGTNCSQV